MRNQRSPLCFMLLRFAWALLAATTLAQQQGFPRLGSATTPASDSSSAPTSNTSSTVFGLGPGLLAIIIIGAVLTLTTAFFSFTKHAWTVLLVSLSVFGALVGVLFAIPKYDPTNPIPEPDILLKLALTLMSNQVDKTYHPRIAFIVFTSVLSTVSVSAAWLMWLVVPTFATKQDD